MHYKRKYPRTAARKGKRRDTWRQRKKFGSDANWMWLCNWPRWHDILFHTRRRRRADKAMTYAVKTGKLDADATVWRLSMKPHIYYW